MNCEQTKLQFDRWSDGELLPHEAAVIEDHLASCAECARYQVEMEAIRGFLSEVHPLPEAVSRQVWSKVRPRSRRARWHDRWSHWFGQLASWIEFERRTLVAQLVAAPLVVGLFVLLGTQFTFSTWQSWTYAVVQMDPAARSNGPATRKPVMVHVLSSQPEVQSLVDTARRLPYEDSLSVVAGIQPEGHAEIESILASPRSLELLEAVDLTLRTTRFARAEVSPESSQSVIIYSFQKIDVYAGL